MYALFVRPGLKRIRGQRCHVHARLKVKVSQHLVNKFWETDANGALLAVTLDVHPEVQGNIGLYLEVVALLQVGHSRIQCVH